MRRTAAVLSTYRDKNLALDKLCYTFVLFSRGNRAMCFVKCEDDISR